MKNNKPKIFATAGLLFGLFALSQAYTNCSKSDVNMNEGTSMTLSPDHPAAQSVTAAQYVAPLGHKKFISSLITENFSNSSSETGYMNALNANVQYWSDNQGAQLGLACNPYESATGQDCNGNISNSNLPLFRSSTTIREAIRIHLCDEILGYDQAVTASLANASVTTSTPDEESIRALTGLFYRADLPSQEFISTFVEMDQHLATEGLGDTDRWRIILVELCESTEWQRL